MSIRRVARIALAAGLLMAARAPEGYPTGAFEVYQATTPPLSVTCEYPAGWQAEESSGSTERYRQVQFYAPADMESRLRMYIVVRAVPLKDQGGKYAGVAEMAGEYRNQAMPGLNVEEQPPVTVLGSTATVLAVNGTLSLPWRSPTPAAVPVSGARVFFEKDGTLYEAAWLATPEHAPAVLTAFSHLLDTLAIQ